MEHEQFETRDVEGTSFLQELGDAHTLAYYGDGRSTVSQIPRVEKNVSPSAPQSMFDSATSQIRNYVSPVQGIDRNDHNHWRTDSTRSEPHLPSTIHGTPVSHWPPDPRLSEPQSYHPYGQSCGPQRAPPTACEWRTTGTQPVVVGTHSVPHYDARVPMSPSSSGRVYPSSLQFSSGYTGVLPTAGDGRDASVPSSTQQSLGCHGECTTSAVVSNSDGNTNPEEASCPIPHNYFDPQEAGNDPRTILAPQCSLPNVVLQTSPKSSQGHLVMKKNERRAPCSPVNGADQYDRPLQQLGRMVSKGCSEPSVKRENQLIKPPTDVVSGSACVLQETRKSSVSPCSHSIPISVSSAPPSEHPGYQRMSMISPPADERGRQRLASGISCGPAPIEPACSIQNDAPLSDWSSYPARGEIDLRPPTPCALKPFHSGRSTLHYRQNPNDRCSRQNSANKLSPGHQPDGTFHQGPSENRVQEADSQLCSNDPASVCVQPIPNGRSNYQLQTCQTYANSDTTIPDPHLRPIAPISPNMASALVGSSPFSHPRVDDAKCNGIGLPENLPIYPPILPKIPGVSSPSKDSSGSPKKRQPMDRAARNERRRLQRLRKKQEAQLSRDSFEPPEISRTETVQESARINRPPKSRSQKRDQESRKRSPRPCDRPSKSGSPHDLPEPTGSECCAELSLRPLSSNKRRRGTDRISDAKRSRPVRQREIRPKVDGSVDDSSLTCITQDSATDQSQITEPSVEVSQTSEPGKQVKAVKTRPPRPKKKRPLPTLIRKKKRSAFYGDDSDSEPDISGRIGGRSESRGASQVENKRRSERTAGDRKRYTVDLDLNLTEDSDANDEEMATLNSTGNVVVTDENDFKVVESVLGRRVTKRVVKKIIQRSVTTPDGRPTTGDSATDEQVEDEEEEDVEEFYLKYKGYSYLHCEWRALDEIDDPRIRPKLRRFEMKQANTLQGEEDDIVLFNPDYVEVERVLDMKVYRNGEQVITGGAKRGERQSGLDSTGLKRETKRERERKRAQALREAKAKARAKAEAAFASFNAPSVASSSSVCSQDEIFDRENSERSNIECVAPSPAREAPNSVAVDEKETTNLHTDSPGICDAADSPSTSHVSTKETPESVENNPTSSNVKVPIANTTSSRTPESCANESDNNSEPEERPSSPVNVTYYLVKWRSLAYEDATWELAQDVDLAKVKEFLKWQSPPKLAPVPRDSNYKIIRPDPSTWRPIESGKVYKNSNKLRDYQLEGVNWLTYCWFHHRNCILADEMGLGKTVQSVTFLLELAKTGIPGPFLVIVPLSTVTNWQREFENWSDFNVVIYHGSGTSRNMIQEYEIFYRRRPSDSAVRHDVYKFNALVTTFEVLMTDIEFFGKIHWAAAIIDEAHRLKNKKCKLGEGLRYLDLDHRVLLTGTPLQNNVEELFGLLNFLEPDRFNCSSTFVAEYGDLKTEEQVESLKALLKPMMLRRLKEDVEKSLAPKEETIVEVELTNIQKKYYRAIMERNFTFLCKGCSSTNAPNLMNVMMELRKCCNHPFLIKGAEDAILADMREQNSSDEPLAEESQTFQALVYASGKLVLIHKLLPKLRADGHKVLIFSQMIRVLDILEDYLIHQRFPFERIDGRIQGPLRQEAIDRFTADPDKFVFLLCTKAGGLGINLTAADVVIIYDSDWNPQNDLQAQARCHRIGQQKMVKVYRLITRNTYEREMFDRASLKLGLDKAVLQSMGSKEARQAQMSKKEIEELLKKGAYGALMDDDKAGEDFCEEDIDKILQSRARVVQLEQGEKNSTFSKATFSISDNRSDIEIDDPNFWQKWAKMAGVDETAGTIKDLIMKTPRQRRQTSRYSALTSEPVAPSPPSYDVSDLDDSATAQSSADENTASGSTVRGRFRRSRRHRRLSRHGSLSRRVSQVSLKTEIPNAVPNPLQVEPLDRADLFRVERCLLTWPWGHWNVGLATVPFKRPMESSELTYFACVVLAYALRFLPPTADPRVKATIVELTRPGVWHLELSEVASRVTAATKKATLALKTVDIISSVGVSMISEPTDSKITVPDFMIAEQTIADSPLPDEPNATSEPDQRKVEVLVEKLEAIDTPLSEKTKSDTEAAEKAEGEVDSASLPDPAAADDTASGMDFDARQPDSTNLPSIDISVKVEVSEHQNEPPVGQGDPNSTVSPKSSSFDPDVLIPFESFRKHVQRGCARLLNRVAFLLFLECEVIGVERSVDFIAGRLTHSDFTDLAASLPPLEAIDADLPIPWWDKCCDKCLLLGVLKHGWEKYASMRLDPALCFRSRAIAALEEKPSKDDVSEAVQITDDETCIVKDKEPVKNSTGTENLEPHVAAPEPRKDKLMDDPAEVDPFSETKGDDGLLLSGTGDDTLAESVLTAIQFPAVADLNSRIRKLVSFFLRVKNQREMECLSKRQFVEESEERFTPPPTMRYVERRNIKWTRREEADFYRVVSSFGVEFTPIKSSTVADPAAPVERIYNWYNFRQLANLNRKSDAALTEYFQAFYRMCQRVCKRPLTKFVEPASSAATSTTSGHSDQGDEVCVDAISEERATRCLSRIDLLARIRNEILPHPNLVERLKLCQRGSEVPNWWVPGKHDGELLRGAAKHGLARTDLNILSDPEFSFSRVISLIRERLSREAAVADYPGDLSANQANRSNIAAVAAAAARAAADQLVREDTNDNIPDLESTKITSQASSAKTEADEENKSQLQTFTEPADLAAGSAPCGLVGEEQQSEETVAAPVLKNEQEDSDIGKPAEDESTKSDLKLSDDEPPKLSPEDSITAKTSGITTAQAEFKPTDTELVSNEWSVKFATNLATAWPKDRTIQHRLELVCQTIERNEWPTPRRYIPTPSTASIPLSDSNRALIESRIINFSTPRISPSPFMVGSPISGRMASGLSYARPIGKQLPDVQPFITDPGRCLENFAVIFQPPSAPENISNMVHVAEDLSNKNVEMPIVGEPSNNVHLNPANPLNLADSPSRRSCFTPNPCVSSQLKASATTPTPTMVEEENSASSSYSKVPVGSNSSTDLSGFVQYPSRSASSVSTSVTTSPQPIRGRGRGRGRGGRVSGSSRGLGRLRQFGGKLSGPGRSPPKSPASESGLLGSPEQTEIEQSMPPPSSRVGSSSSPHRPTGTRGRKRKLEGTRGAVHTNLAGRPERPNAKRERIDQSSSVSSTHARATRGSHRGAQVSTESDVWDIRVPVISLVDGSLIYGDKAPKRKSLEAWLESNPNYMPYSVEMEDRAIYSRVASARGQDTHNMEALAYKHYLNSLIASATAASMKQTPTPLSQPPPSIASTSAQANKSSLVTQQQYLQLQQQQQLLTALSAYARHPAYAGLVASALTSWQAAAFGTGSTGTLPLVSDAGSSTATPILSPRHGLSGSSGGGSVSTRTRSVSTRNSASPNLSSAERPPPAPTITECVAPSTVSSSSASTSDVTASITSGSSVATTAGVDALLSAAYKQATTNLAYMYNPMAAVAAYSQMLLSSSNPMAGDVAVNNQSALSGQQAALASLYTNYMFAAKQQQQQQQQQQTSSWDQQRQQLSALTNAVASACGGTGTVDTATLMAMLSASKPSLLGSMSMSGVSAATTGSSSVTPTDQVLPTTCSSSSIALDVSKQSANIDPILTTSTLPSSSTDVATNLSGTQTQVDQDSSNTKEVCSSGESTTDDADHTSTVLDLSK